jgi:hypothetical protein
MDQDSKEKDFENWAEDHGIELTPELYLQNQRMYILNELALVGVTVDLPSDFMWGLNSQQFAEVIAGVVGRIKG